MATKGTPDNQVENAADDPNYVLRQYLSTGDANDEDNLQDGLDDHRAHDNDDYGHEQDQEDYEEDFEDPVDDGQIIPKDEPELVGEDAQNDAKPEIPLDDIDQDIPSNNGDDVEFEESEEPEDLAHVKDDPNIWTLPADRDTCTLEEIRRGQVINRVAPNECPVMGCGKKINEMRAEPSPGTISSGLRTHVLFVHYAMTCKRAPKKRKLAWSGKRRSSASPKKHPHSNEPDFETEPENFAMRHPSLPGASLIQRGPNSQNRNSLPGSILNNKIKQLSANNTQQPQAQPQPQQSQQHQHQSSLQSLIQATGINFGAKNGPSASQKSFNQTTSSLFSILAGITQQQQQNQQHSQHQTHQQTNHRANLSLTSSTQQLPRNAKPAHGANTLSLSQCSRNGNSNHFTSTPPINSSLLTLLNEKISGNVASSLQSHLKKSIDSNNKGPSVTNPRINTPTNNNHYYQSNVSNVDNNNYNNINNPLLNSLNISNGENSSSSLNPFIESIAKKTGSNIGPGGVIEAKKIIEKFVTWLMYSSQTIADHYIAPYAGEAPQQKPEISASDVILAYKMMQKSQPQ